MKRTFAELLLVSMLGCTSSSAVSPGASDATAGGTQATFGDSPCGQCVTTACAAAVTACNGTPDCQAYEACVEACPVDQGDVDPICVFNCPAPTSSSGQQGESQLAACRATGAGASCTACGASSDPGDAGGLLHENCALDLDASNACAKCEREQCCDVRTTCLNDPNCLSLLDCESDCISGVPDEAGPTTQPPEGGPYSCDEWCNAQSNPSLSEWARLQECGELLCASQCGGGDTCTMCLTQYCANESVAESTTPDGFLFNDCLGQCATGDTGCDTLCLTTYSSVTPAFSSLGTCLQQYCPSCF